MASSSSTVDFEANADKFLTFLKCLSDLSSTEQTALIDNASDKHINSLAQFIGQCSGGRILCQNKSLFKKMTKHSDLFVALKLAKKNKITKERISSYKALLRSRHSLINILGQYLEGAFDDFHNDRHGINPITLLPKVVPKKRAKNRNQPKQKSDSDVTSETTLQENRIVGNAMDDKEIKSEANEEPKDLNAMIIQN